ncbi:MAG TPA: IS66 family transposase [Gemmataceae bacterium]|nr:IS66 family transposase [Gemmataceae bacterium]
MNHLSILTDELFAAYLKCPQKAYLKLTGAVGEPSDYMCLQERSAADYRAAAQQASLQTVEGATVVRDPSAARDAIRRAAALILEPTLTDAGDSCRLDALFGPTARASAAGAGYTPVLFIPHQTVSTDDRLRLAFGASVLARIQDRPPEVGKVIHGRQFKVTRVALPTLTNRVADTVGQIRALAESASPPPLALNRHCVQCEFRRRCREAAVEKDDLSLLRGLSSKDIAGLHRRGIFTVTQYSYTFRPGRLKRVAGKPGGKADHALQALALRERKIYVARRPQLPVTGTRAYLDVEGLPDTGLYYLIGLTVEDSTGRRHLSWWADRAADEPAVWAAFLGAARELGDEFVLYHYGSYETQFLKTMEDRHGGDPDVLARIRSRSVNVLSAIHAQVYFPVYANDLKSVAGSLGFKWSEPGATGLQAIVWRSDWEATGDPAVKDRLLTYNREDCAALDVVTTAVRALGADSPPASPGIGPPVAEIDEIERAAYRKYGQTQFALPEFAGITKCAYFDYQRDKVLCRTNPAVKESLRRKDRCRGRAPRVNRVVDCQDVKVCPLCGSTGLDTHTRYQRCVIDLKPFLGGVKRCVTRYRVVRRRCRTCWRTFLPQDYLALPSKYGWGVYSWAVYASTSLRQTNDAVAESLQELFGIALQSAMVSRLRRIAADRYRATYEGLLSDLRNGPLIHADETRVALKGPTGTGYVWVFASPDTAVYFYSPTRSGANVHETLAGFQGVLVSDFYAVYDGIDCPQQKCLIHLIRDLNDDLLRNPFDEDLKRLAARFTALLQPVIATIDRFGLKQHHLGKHRRDVERYFAAETAENYRSELAGGYRTRLLKYREKLFTFLDHDGVPWNNNNAENAIKLFASRRKVMDGLFTEAGIRDYLLLLSLYQTTRYRNLSFWRFLLSGQSDLAAFATNKR